MDRTSPAVLTALFLLASSLSGCGSAPPPPAPLPPPPPAAEAPKEEPPPPPPPPKCESLTEKCAATADTRVPVGGASIQPPIGWTYSKEGSGVMAVSPEDDGVFLMTDADGAEPAKTLPVIKGLLEKLGVTEVKLPKLEKRLKKPQSTVEASGAQIGLWELDKDQQGADPKRADKVGAALVVVGSIAGKVVVGVSFVRKGAPGDRASAIVDSIKSLRGGG